MAKERIAYFDFMKGLCILLIVIGHVDDSFFDSLLPNLNFALKSFRIPLYFFLSGLFFKEYGGFSEFLRKKINNLIVTLLFFHFLSCALRFPLVSIVHAFRPDIDVHFSLFDILPPFFGRFWSSAGALWFLVALFMVNILYYAFQKLFNKTGVLIAVLMCSACGWVLMKHKVQLPFEFDVALVALPYFMLGSIVKQMNLLKKSKYDKYGILVIIPSALIIYWYSSDINFLYQFVPNYFNLYAVPFLAILSLFWCCKNLNYVPLICYIGRYSIIVLGTHQVLISYVWCAYTGILGLHGFHSNVTTFITVLVLEILIIPIMVKYFPRFTAQKEFFKANWTL